MNTHLDLSSVLKTSIGAIPSVIEHYFWAMIGFSVTAAVAFTLTLGKDKRPSLSETIAHVFPNKLYRHRSTKVDLVNFILQIGIWQPLITLIGIVVVGISTRDLLIANFGERPPVLHSPWTVVPIQFAVSFLIGDLASYVQHLCLHKIPVLWSFHRCHHSAEALTFFTERRAHPLDLVWGLLVGGSLGGAGTGLALYLLGTPLSPETTAALSAFYGTAFPFLGLLQHSHVRISFGGLDHVFTSPAQHQLHHSAELRHRDKNLGGILMLFDWLFGTIYIGHESEEYRWGLSSVELGDSNPHNSTRRFYLEPFGHAGHIIAKVWKGALQTVSPRN